MREAAGDASAASALRTEPKPPIRTDKRSYLHQAVTKKNNAAAAAAAVVDQTTDVYVSSTNSNSSADSSNKGSVASAPSRCYYGNQRDSEFTSEDEACPTSTAAAEEPVEEPVEEPEGYLNMDGCSESYLRMDGVQKQVNSLSLSLSTRSVRVE